MKLFERIGEAAEALAASIKSIAKIAILARRVVPPKRPADTDTIIILGNGPSLADTIANHSQALKRYPLMAVNFAAIAPEFTVLRPQYYILADPHFFSGATDGNLPALRRALATVAWPMNLIVPAREKQRALSLTDHNPNITLATFNPIAVEGIQPLSHAAFRAGLGMPRPRNVLIPAIMEAIAAGFKRIFIVGADHSWMKTLDVNDSNEVISIQPHFYTDSSDEQQRITAVYRNIHLHQIVESFAIAFRAYHHIAAYARARGIQILNATPRSFIDAFPRSPLPS